MSEKNPAPDSAPSLAANGGNEDSQVPPIHNIHNITEDYHLNAAQPPPPAYPALDPNNQFPSQPDPYTEMAIINAAKPAAEASAGPSTPAAATPAPATTLPQPALAGKAAAQPDAPPSLPAQAQAHGAPTRQYLNELVVPHYLLATKYLAAHRPAKPLQFLAEFFAEKSRQIEGTE